MQPLHWPLPETRPGGSCPKEQKGGLLRQGGAGCEEPPPPGQQGLLRCPSCWGSREGTHMWHWDTERLLCL